MYIHEYSTAARDKSDKPKVPPLPPSNSRRNIELPKCAIQADHLDKGTAAASKQQLHRQKA